MSLRANFHSASEFKKMIQSGEASAEDIVQTAIDRLHEVNSSINAVTATREAAALKEARLADKLQMDKRGPLHGIPILIKDLNETKDMPTTYGSRAFQGYMADVDALVVERIVSAGGIIIGKTNTPEFGLRPITHNSLFGATNNPFDLRYNSGGSSGGAAAALASGIVALAQGGDGGGSCRIPASCCGVVGMKPSRGRVPWAPNGFEVWDGMAINGPLARTVDDAKILYRAMQGAVVGEPYGVSVLQNPLDIREKLKIGVCFNAPHGPVEEQVRVAVENVARELEGAGYIIEEVELAYNKFLEPYITMLQAYSAMTVEHVVGKNSLHKLEAHTILCAIGGYQKSAMDYTWAMETIRNHSAIVMQSTIDFDAIITPTLTRPAPLNLEHLDVEIDAEQRIYNYLEWLGFTYPVNCTGQPAISVPAGRTHEGLPIGVQVIGRMGDDVGVFNMAALIEKLLPWSHTYKDIVC